MNEPKLTPAAERLNSAPEGQPESYMSVALRLGPELEKAQANIDALLKENRELKARLFGEHNLREEENAVHFGEMEELETQLAELQAQLATVNDPTFDGTDAAHPAWWRGHDYTAEKVKEKVAGLQAQLTEATARADREAEMRHRYERENERLCDAVETQEGVISELMDKRDSLRAALEEYADTANWYVDKESGPAHFGWLGGDPTAIAQLALAPDAPAEEKGEVSE